MVSENYNLIFLQKKETIYGAINIYTMENSMEYLGNARTF
jgi:hypothetical protein